jgi:cold shock protein
MKPTLLSAATVPAFVASLALAACGEAQPTSTPTKPVAVRKDTGTNAPLSAAAADYGKEGTVTFWNAAKGFGSIEEQDTGHELFVHVTGLRPPLTALTPGQRVRYRVRSARKGVEAYDVTVPGAFLAASGRRGG